MAKKLILDADLRAKLNGLREPVEVCDESGKVVGCFLSDDDYWKLWLEAADREAVTAASHQIELSLREDPDQVGESRPDGSRILLAPRWACIST